MNKFSVFEYDVKNKAIHLKKVFNLKYIVLIIGVKM